MSKLDINKVLVDYDSMLYQLANKTTINGYETDDIMQELRLVAVDCVNKYDESVGQFSTYLYKSCLHRIYRLRNVNKHNELSLDNEIPGGDGETFLDTLESQELNPEQQMLADEKEETIQHILQQLPPDDYTIINGLFYENLTQSEVAEMLGRSQSYVAKQQTRIFSKLRKEFEKYGIILS